MKKTTMSTLVLALSSALAIGASVKAYADTATTSSSTSTNTTATTPAAKSSSGSVGQFVDDATITTRVKSKFAADSTVSAMHINVDTAKGVVTLTGNVASQAEKDQAIALAKAVPDVKSVKSNLTIKSSASSSGSTSPTSSTK